MVGIETAIFGMRQLSYAVSIFIFQLARCNNTTYSTKQFQTYIDCP